MNYATEEQIEILRKKMIEKYFDKKSFIDMDVIETSEELDQFILQYLISKRPTKKT